MRLISSLLLIIALLCSCSNNSPRAWEFDAGMTKEQVTEILNQNYLKYEEDGNEINVEGTIDFCNQKWDSMCISFNNNEQLYEVAFYDQSNSINCYSLCDEISKQVGDDKGYMGTLTVWSKDNDYFISFANNSTPFFQTLVYRYPKFYNEDADSDNSSTDETIDEE